MYLNSVLEEFRVHNEVKYIGIFRNISNIHIGFKHNDI